MPFIKAETFQNAAYLLDESGRIWRVDVDYEGQPVMRLVERVDRCRLNALLKPLAAAAGEN